MPIAHHFEVSYSNPIYHSARGMASLQNNFVLKEFDKMLDAEIITSSNSAWCFPIVIVSKMDGTPRLYVDY